jgi:hypothetical protein
MSKPPDNINTPAKRALFQDDFIVLRISRIGQAPAASSMDSFARVIDANDCTCGSAVEINRRPSCEEGRC